MKDLSLTPLAVVTADQVGSRTAADRVPQALDALGRLEPVTLGFERTVGDEIQGLVSDPSIVVRAVETLTRLGDWRIGIGIGAVDRPLPRSTREARGAAYLAAREAIEAARNSPAQLALVVAPSVSGGHYGDLAGRNAETALMLLRTVLARRTAEGWELMDLLAANPSSRNAAEQLGISPSAVSQRLARSGRVEADRAAALATHLLGLVLEPSAE